jgi:drug/metabolite transporter (DMT)-like permease
MKLNFWQILGIALILIGVIFVVRKQMAGPATPPPTVAPAVTPEPTPSAPSTDVTP